MPDHMRLEYTYEAYHQRIGVGYIYVTAQGVCLIFPFYSKCRAGLYNCTKCVIRYTSESICTDVLRMHQVITIIYIDVD